MSRNITILVIILIVILIAGYLLWLRGKFQAPQQTMIAPVTDVTTAPTKIPAVEVVASSSATTSGKPKTATVSGKKITPTPTVAKK